jgi:hypothetical protein
MKEALGAGVMLVWGDKKIQTFGGEAPWKRKGDETTILRRILRKYVARM